MKKKNNNYKIEIYDGDDNKKYVLLDDFKVILQAGQDIRKKYEIAETRIDKAIEYIENHKLDFKQGITTFGSERLTMEERELLNILRGEDEFKKSN